MGERPSWDNYFMQLLDLLGSRSTCEPKLGCVIVKNNRILTTGYNGSMPGLDHCDDVGHLRKKVTHEDGTVTAHCLRTIHAEMNAILQAAKVGLSVDGATLYVKMEPCLNCCKAIIGAGITRVVAAHPYKAAQDSRIFFEKASVELVVLSDEPLHYGDAK